MYVTLMFGAELLLYHPCIKQPDIKIGHISLADSCFKERQLIRLLLNYTFPLLHPYSSNSNFLVRSYLLLYIYLLLFLTLLYYFYLEFISICRYISYTTDEWILCINTVLRCFTLRTPTYILL